MPLTVGVPAVSFCAMVIDCFVLAEVPSAFVAVIVKV
jgi:hypothetical protein